MSYWVYLENKESASVQVPMHTEGGVMILGGTELAEMNVTYNYSVHFSVKNELHGKTAEETIPILEGAVEHFGTERTMNYWDASEGNVGYMCSILLSWAKLHPDAIWRVS